MYTHAMRIISFVLTRVIAQYPLLAATIGAGVFFCFLLFAFCFSGVHILRFTQQTTNKTKTTSSQPKKPPEVEKEKQTPSQEPVYYIVERKQRRNKPRYGEPKEIRFK